MKRLIIYFLLIISTTSLSADIKTIKSVNQLESNKKIIMMFSTFYCPWCLRQESVLNKVQKDKQDIQIVVVKDSSRVYKELLKEYPFVIEVFPTTYIVKNVDGKLDILYEFMGYQGKQNILDVLNSEDEI